MNYLHTPAAMVQPAVTAKASYTSPNGTESTLRPGRSILPTTTWSSTGATGDDSDPVTDSWLSIPNLTPPAKWTPELAKRHDVLLHKKVLETISETEDAEFQQLDAWRGYICAPRRPQEVLAEYRKCRAIAELLGVLRKHA